jgi:hypothetical protein
VIHLALILSTHIIVFLPVSIRPIAIGIFLLLFALRLPR